MYAKNAASSGQRTAPQREKQTIDLASLAFSVEPLVPLSDDPWPTFDVVEAFTYENDPHLAPTVVTKNLAPAVDATPTRSPAPSPQKSHRRVEPLDQRPSSTVQKKSSKSSEVKRIPRPRNAFMIYRSTVWAQQKIPMGIERDHRHISRIIGHCWNSLPEEEKRIWKAKAEEEKQEHSRKYPDYRYSPMTRTDRPIKRNVNRNGEKDKQRCKKVAELLLAGTEGSALESAVKELDANEKHFPTRNSPISPYSSQSPATPLFSSEPLYRDEALHSPTLHLLPRENPSHGIPTFSLSMLTPPEDILPLPMTPASSGGNSQCQYPLYPYGQPYSGMPAYLASPETTPVSLGGGHGLFSPTIGWEDYPSGIHTPHDDLYYA